MKPGSKAPVATVANSGVAPIIFADGVTAYGQANGVIALEFAASVLVPMADGTIKTKSVAVLHLRLPSGGALGLAEAIEKVLTVAAPPTKQ